MKKLFFTISILVIASMVLAACGAPATTAAPPTAAPATAAPATAAPATAAPATAAPATEPPAPALSGTVRVGSWDSADALTPFNNSITSFEAAYPGVKVQLESVPQNYGDKLLAEFASGTAPDVFQVGDGDVARFAAQGVFEPLDPYIAGTKGSVPLDTSVFIKAVADIGKVGGTTYLLTKDSSPLVLYYNKKMFDAAGVAYPTDKWTWNDMLDAAKKLTITSGGTTSQWGIQLPDGWGDPTWVRGILPFIYQNGGDVISADGKKVTTYLDSDATIAALQFYADFITKYKVAPSKADVAAFNGADLFQTGKVAMLWTGVWPLNGYIKDTTISIGTSTLPTGPSGTRANSICWAGFALYSKGQNKDAAWAFLRWIGADKGAQEFANYALTDVKAIADAQGKTTDPYFGSVMSDLGVVHPLPDFTTMKWNDCVNTPLTAALDTYFTSGGDMKALMTKVASDADVCLAKP